MKPGASFGEDQIADWLLSSGTVEAFVAAIEAGDRRRVVKLLLRPSRDETGQTAQVLADLYLSDETILKRLLERADSPK